MTPDKPPFRGCENPPKAFQHFSHQATAIHRLYRNSLSVAFRTAAASVLLSHTVNESTIREKIKNFQDSAPSAPEFSLQGHHDHRSHNAVSLV